MDWTLWLFIGILVALGLYLTLYFRKERLKAKAEREAFEQADFELYKQPFIAYATDPWGEVEEYYIFGELMAVNWADEYKEDIVQPRED